jgi:hypothetical protein
MNHLELGPMRRPRPRADGAQRSGPPAPADSPPKAMLSTRGSLASSCEMVLSIVSAIDLSTAPRSWVPSGSWSRLVSALPRRQPSCKGRHPHVPARDRGANVDKGRYGAKPSNMSHTAMPKSPLIVCLCPATAPKPCACANSYIAPGLTLPPKTPMAFTNVADGK